MDEKVGCDKILLFPWIPELISNQKSDSLVSAPDCTVPLLYLASTAAGASTVPTEYFLYNETYLGFIPLQKDADGNFVNVYDLESDKILSNHRCGKDKCKWRKDFCNDVVTNKSEERFTINKETIVAWALIEQMDLLSKDKLTFNDGTRFPYSVEQLKAIRTYCPNINSDVNSWIKEEKNSLSADDVTSGMHDVGICSLFNDKGLKSDSDLNIPVAYKNKLREVSDTGGTIVAALAGKCKKWGLSNPYKGQLKANLIDSLMADEVTKKAFKEYQLRLDAINEATKPSSEVLKNLKSDYKQERKDNRIKNQEKCNADKKTWWKSFTCYFCYGITPFFS